MSAMTSKKPLARVWTKDEDYSLAGVTKDQYQRWEDGWRGKGAAGVGEWWFMMATLENGGIINASIADKDICGNRRGERVTPWVDFSYTPPGGGAAEMVRGFNFDIPASESTFATDKMAIKIGQNSWQQEEDKVFIKIAGEGFEAIHGELEVTNIGKPWRPGTGDIRLGWDEERYYNITIPFMMAEVKGRVVINGEPMAVKGACHIEHQWMNICADYNIQEWFTAHWPWAPYAFHLYDLTFGKDFDFARVPLLVIVDQNGTVFENLADELAVEVRETVFDQTYDMELPKDYSYYFENDRVKGELRFQLKEVVLKFSVNDMPNGDPLVKEYMAANNLYMNYLRQKKTCTFTIEEKDTGKVYSDSRDIKLDNQVIGEEFLFMERSRVPIAIRQRRQ